MKRRSKKRKVAKIVVNSGDKLKSDQNEDFKELSHQERIDDINSNSHMTKLLNPNVPWLQQQFSSRVLVDGDYGHWKRDLDQGGIIFTKFGEGQSKEQKSKALIMTKNVLKAFFTGTAPWRISQPIEFFDGWTQIQSTVSEKSLIPPMMNKVVQSSKLDQFKMVIANCIVNKTQVFWSKTGNKPINPILGETCQGHFSGDPIYAEQTLHHPPHSNVSIYGKGYAFHQSIQLKINMTMEPSFGINFRGTFQVHFKNNDNLIEYSDRCFKVTNLFGSDKPYNIINYQLFWSKSCEMIAIIWYGQEKGQVKDTITGGIYKASPEKIQEIKDQKIWQNHDNLKTVQDFVKQFEGDKLHDISGYWSLFIKIDGQKVWKFDSLKPYKYFSSEKCLPSDTTLRKDSLYINLNDLEKASKFKDEMENMQRNDRTLREKYGPKK